MKVKDHFLSKEIFEIQETEIPGILKTNPVPLNIEKYYESTDYISHHQDKGGLKEKLYKFVQQFNLKYKKKVLKTNLTSLSEKPKVLDYGCGAGEFLKCIEEDFTTYGYEPNDSARSFAKKKTTKTKFVESLDEIPDNSLDAITLWHVFEHIENQQDILEIFYKKLKTNGLLIIAVPNYTSYDGRKYKEFWAAYDVPRHIYHFSRAGMITLMHTEKWSMKKITPLLLDSYYISMLSEKYKKNPLFWILGGINGAISNFKALKTGEFSSLIYTIKKV